MKTLMRSIAIALVFIHTTAFANQTGRSCPSKNTDIVDTAIAAGQFKTLAAALGAAGLVETLKGPGPFTVFAPTNDAVGKLPAGTVESLLKPESKATLVKILTYHVVAGDFDAGAVIKAIKTGKGSAKLKTVSGGTLTASLKDGKVILTDETGKTSTVITADLKAGNGVVHVVDAVVLPK